MDRSQKSQIRNLLAVLGAGLLSAFLVAGILLYKYGPSGRYAFKSTLLAPELVTGLSFNDTNSKTGGTSRFVFGGIEYAYYDFQEKQWKQVPITLEQYANLYQEVGNQESLANVDDEVVSFFNEGNPPKLILLARTESDASWQESKKPFQEVQFSNNGNYFRIQLREDNRGIHWAYFYFPGILDKIRNISLNN